MGLFYLLYLTVSLPIEVDYSKAEDIDNQMHRYEMIAEVNTWKERKYQKKQNKKNARLSSGKRRDVRREHRRERDIKGFRREHPTLSKQRSSEQKEHRRKKLRERHERKTG